MRTVNVLVSAFHLIIVLFTFALGALFVMLYFKSQLVYFLIDNITDEPQIFLKIGFYILIFSTFLFICFYYMHKSQYLKFSMQTNKTSINIKLVQNLLEKYFKNTYPDKKNKLKVSLDENEKLEIIATVDSLENREDFLINIEEKISKILLDHLDYQKDFIFTLKSRN